MVVEFGVGVITGKIREFLETESFSSFKKWMEEQVEKNQPTMIHTNPPNHVYDLEDGTMNLVVGRESVALARQRCKQQEAGLFKFHILKEGSFKEVLAFLGTIEGNVQLEGAMAFYDEAVDSYVTNSEQFQSLVQIIGGKMPENVEHPFYRGVCEEILRLFREKRWI